ncbi:MAG: hypothetical protein H0X17_00885 [Deltaproteobacteria bacterium]|nr:hypothetical protein [Deltaproteobacteria bacterium]
MRKLITFSALVSGLAAAATACTTYAPELGNAPYLCGMVEPFCPEDYFCQTTAEPAPRDRVCVSSAGLLPDSGTTGFQCSDDGPLEGSTKNDTPQTAYMTPVDTQRQDLSLAGLAICPEGDKDFYAVTLSAANPNKSLEVVVSWDSGQPISMSITNASGTSLVNGVAMGDKSLRACAPNLPTGTYFGSVFASGSTKNNYRLAIKVVANCAQ